MYNYIGGEYSDVLEQIQRKDQLVQHDAGDFLMRSNNIFQLQVQMVQHITMRIMDFGIMFQQRGILQRDMEKSLLQIGLGVR